MAELYYNSLFSDANLIGYWRLENVNDSKASYTLTNNNTVTFTTGVYNNASNFGATNTNKSLDSASNLTIDGGACSICCRVKLLAEIGSGTWTLVGQSSKTTSYVREQLSYDYNGGTQRIGFNRTKNNVAAETSYYTITLGTANWYHMVYTYDATNIRGYVNGALVAGPTAASGAGGNSAGHDGFAIGAGCDGGNTARTMENFSSSVIDDVAVFNRALSAAEVLSLFSGGHGLTTLSVGS
jgi:hypothetical protein